MGICFDDPTTTRVSSFYRHGCQTVSWESLSRLWRVTERKDLSAPALMHVVCCESELVVRIDRIQKQLVHDVIRRFESFIKANVKI